MLAKPQTQAPEKPIYVANPVEMTQEQREAFRREILAKHSNIIAYLAR